MSRIGLSSCGLGPIVTLRPRQNGRYFADDIFKCIFLNENVWIPIEISQTFVPKGSINYNPALLQIMAWRRPGDKPLSEPMMVSSLTHICVTRPQWVKLHVSWINFIPAWISNYIPSKVWHEITKYFGADYFSNSVWMKNIIPLSKIKRLKESITLHDL